MNKLLAALVLLVAGYVGCTLAWSALDFVMSIPPYVLSIMTGALGLGMCIKLANQCNGK